MPEFSADAVMHEMRERVRDTAGASGDRCVKAAIGWAAKKLGITPGRAKNLYYGEARSVTAWEADQIRARSQQAQLEALHRQRHEYEARRREFLTSAPGALARLAPPSLADLEDEPAAVETPRRAGGAR